MVTPSPRHVGWTRWLFRVASTVSAIMLFDQAVFAGQFLDGAFGSLHTHRENATLAGISVLVTLVAAVLRFRPGRGPAWPIAAAVLLFGLIAAQIALGFARVIWLHVPLGVGLIVGSALLSAWSWRAR